MSSILRTSRACQKLDVGKSHFHTHFRYAPGHEFVPGTNIPRLRAVRLGPGSVGYLADEIDGLIEALRRRRDETGAPAPTSVSQP